MSKVIETLMWYNDIQNDRKNKIQFLKEQKFHRHAKALINYLNIKVQIKMSF